MDALAEETKRLIAEIEADVFAQSPRLPPPGTADAAKSRAAPPASAPSTGSPPPPPENALIVVVQLVCSCVRHVREPQSKLLALQLLLRFGRHLDDEARLQRLVPYLVALLEGPDQIASVRASAVRVLRDVLSLVTKFPASDAELFPKYIFPTLQKLPTDPEELVRIAFAESLAALAETSRRFLEIAQGLVLSQLSGDAAAGGGALGGGGGSGTSSDGAGKAKEAAADAAAGGEAAFALKLEQLHGTVSKWIHDLVGDSDMAASFSGQSSSLGSSGASQGRYHSAARSNLVKRALLRDITRLCIFFGAAGTEQKLLPLLITMINDRDWELRYALCAHIPALGAFLGPVVTETFIMPLSHPLIVDVEELVVRTILGNEVVVSPQCWPCKPRSSLSLSLSIF
jgi:phosphoinositide-3-kinase regulatory subunit 4